MASEFDILMRRGPRWAWDELDEQLDTYQAILEAFIPLNPSFQQHVDDLKKARSAIKELASGNLVPFKTKVPSESEFEASLDKLRSIGFRGRVPSVSSAKIDLIRDIQALILTQGSSVIMTKIKVDKEKPKPKFDLVGTLNPYTFLSRAF